MKLVIIKNPNKSKYNEVSDLVDKNDGYCPCSIVKNKDTKCMCKDFRDSNLVGYCHCGRYCKISETNGDIK